jgi:hypothetical protein
MIDENRLRRLRSRGLAPPPLDAVVRRGKEIQAQQRRVHRITVATICVVVAAVVGVGVVTAVSDRPTRVEVAAPIGAGDPGAYRRCSGFTESRPPESVDDLRYLPSWLPSGHKIERAWARADLLARETCPRVPVALSAVRFEAGSDRVAASFSLEGPWPVAYARSEGTNYEVVSVRRTTGHLVRVTTDPSPGERLVIHWTEPAGASWQLDARGLNSDEVLSITKNLKIGTDGEWTPATAGWMPSGFETIYQRQEPMVATPAEARFWEAGIDDGATFNLMINETVTNDPPVSRLLPGDVRIVTVRGQQAVTTTVLGQVTLRWEEQPGIVVTVSGKFDLATMSRIAESLEPIEATDPRITN